MLKKADESARANAARIFSGWDETIIWSCLNGTMGEINVIELDGKTVLAQAVLADFVFLAGDISIAGENSAAALAGNLSTNSALDYIIIIPQNEQWESIIESVYAGRLKKITRYAMKKNTSFDKERLLNLLHSVPDEYTIVPVNHELYSYALSMQWSHDLCKQYASWDDIPATGLASWRSVTENRSPELHRIHTITAASR